MSLVRILQKSIVGKKNPLIFVGEGDDSEQTFFESWDSLTNHGELKPIEIKFDRVNLYNAVRGYLEDKGITYKTQGKISANYLLRLDEDKDIKVLMQFLADVKKYGCIEDRLHSNEEQKELETFKEQLTKYALMHR